jgi:hypothetical protein
MTDEHPEQQSHDEQLKEMKEKLETFGDFIEQMVEKADSKIDAKLAKLSEFESIVKSLKKVHNNEINEEGEKENMSDEQKKKKVTKEDVLRTVRAEARNILAMNEVQNVRDETAKQIINQFCKGLVKEVEQVIPPEKSEREVIEDLTAVLTEMKDILKERNQTG